MTALSKDGTKFVETKVDDETIIMSLDRGDFFSMRETAQTIWEAIDGTRDRDGIIRAVAGAYDVLPEHIAPDVNSFLKDLNAAGFVKEGCRLRCGGRHQRPYASARICNRL